MIKPNFFHGMNFEDMSSVRILRKKEKAKHECQKKNDDLKCTTDQPNLSKYRIVTKCKKSKIKHLHQKRISWFGKITRVKTRNLRFPRQPMSETLKN